MLHACIATGFSQGSVLLLGGIGPKTNPLRPSAAGAPPTLLIFTSYAAGPGERGSAPRAPEAQLKRSAVPKPDLRPVVSIEWLEVMGLRCGGRAAAAGESVRMISILETLAYHSQQVTPVYRCEQRMMAKAGRHALTRDLHCRS